MFGVPMMLCFWNGRRAEVPESAGREDPGRVHDIGWVIRFGVHAVLSCAIDQYIYLIFMIYFGLSKGHFSACFARARSDERLRWLGSMV
jgi:hypothetical protein